MRMIRNLLSLPLVQIHIRRPQQSARAAVDGSQCGSQAREQQRTVTDSADEVEPVTGADGRPRTPADEPPMIS